MREADSGVLRRHFVAVATGTYDSPEWDGLPVADEVRALRSWLCDGELGKRRFGWAYPELADAPDRDRLRTVLEGLQWRDSDAAVVFVTGHGENAEGSHWIVLKQTEPGRWHRTALRTADVVGWLKDSGVVHLLLILDLCHAGRVIQHAAAFDSDVPPTWLVLPSTGRDQQAHPGVFTGAVTGVLADLASPEGERFGRHNRLLKVEDFLQALEENLGGHQRLIPLPGSQLHGPHPCLPNPHYRPDAHVPVTPARRDLAVLQADMDAHWGPRGRGVTDAQDTGWFFTGRSALMRELVRTLQAEPGAVVLTGAAGTGKSAVLARLVTLADPVFLSRHQALAARIPAELCPPSGAVDVAVLATGKTAAEIAHQISGALSIAAPDSSTDPHLTRWADAWDAWTARRKKPLTIVIDAIDEAHDPGQLLRDLLATLASSCASGHPVHLLLGVRSPGGPKRQHPAAGDEPGGRDQSLADRIERQLCARRIRVDEAPWYDHDDLADYGAEILSRSEGTPYTDTQQAQDVARELADHARRSYLIVRIAASMLTRRPHPVEPDGPGWLAAVDDGIRGVFRADLHQSLSDPQARLSVLHLLRALAFSRGKGLPWNRIWTAVADAVADDGGHGRFTDRDVSRLLASPLGGYLTADVADDTTVYRLFHDALRTALRDHWRDLANTAPFAAGLPITAEETTATESAIARALSDLAVQETENPARLVSPYIRRHLAEHAADGDVLDDETLKPALLPQLDLARIRPLLTETAAGRLSSAPVLRRLSRLWNFQHPHDNASTLELWSAASGVPLPGQAGGSWHVVWAQWRPDESQVLGNHPGLTAVASVTAPAGRALALSGGDDGLVRVWDLTDPDAAPRVLHGGIGAVRSVAGVALPDGRVLAVAGGSNGTAVWDLTAHTAEPAYLAPKPGDVRSVAALVLADGRACIVVGGANAVWALDITEHRIDYLSAFALGELHCVTAVSLPDGRVIALVLGRDAIADWVPRGRTERLWGWDMTKGNRVYFPGMTNLPDARSVAAAVLPDDTFVVLVGGADRVWAKEVTANGSIRNSQYLLHGATTLTMAALPTGDALVVAGGTNGTWVWNRAHEQFRRAGVEGQVRSVAAVVQPGGTALGIAAGEHDLVRVWDLADQESAPAPQTARSEWTDSIAGTALPDGNALAVAGGANGAVRVWDLARGEAEPTTTFQTPHFWFELVAALALPDGRPIALAGEHGGVLALWDLTEQHADPVLLQGVPPGMVSVAAVAVSDGGAFAVAGGREGVTVWDLADLAAPGVQLGGHAGEVVSVAAVAVSDGGAFAVAGGREGVTVWDLADPAKPGMHLGGHSGEVTSVTGVALPDGRVYAVAGGADGRLATWNLSTSRLTSLIHVPGGVTSLAATVLHGNRLMLILGGVRGIACLELGTLPAETHRDLQR
ncbi:AAA family ATPase [Streptomyces chartreusis]